MESGASYLEVTDIKHPHRLLLATYVASTGWAALARSW